MAQIAIIERKCNGCGLCVQRCPFGGIEIEKGKAQMNAACKVCGLCLKACPNKAITRLETKTAAVDKSAWQGILVFAEQTAGKLHPVSLELIGKAKAMAKGSRHEVNAVLLGDEVAASAEMLRHYGVNHVYTYQDEALSFFRADVFADCVEDCIRYLKPSVVLLGATSLGRSLAPRLSTRLHTGLTADCTSLEMRENSDLIQIRPAFGGNIMAQIITPNTRPQFATVRYKVMDSPVRQKEASGDVVARPVPKAVQKSEVRLVSAKPVEKSVSISDAEILVVAGRGLEKEADLGLIRDLAQKLGGDYAVTRPLVEKGWAPHARQIGLSGRTVRPKLIITCGVSGAVQFTAAMNNAEHIIAINKDAQAPIFKVAHIGIVGDFYEVLPKLAEAMQKEAGV
jgi:Electron transfer flavoprotein, alpha subunit